MGFRLQESKSENGRFLIPARHLESGPFPGGMKMRLSFGKITAIIVILSVTAGAPVHAVLMKLDFEGSITSISPPYALPGINLGDEVSGELVFDTATPDSQPVTWIGAYIDAIKSLKLAVGSRSFSLLQPPDTTEIDVINDDLVFGVYYDNMLFRAAVIDQSTQVTRFFQLTFSQSAVTPPTALTSDALAASVDMNAFEKKIGFLTYMPPGVSAGNNITLTSVSLYPEPGWGDVNGDFTVNLSDAILALQVMSNMNPAPLASTNADVDGDGKIGTMEVIYILQKVAGQR